MEKANFNGSQLTKTIASDRFSFFILLACILLLLFLSSLILVSWSKLPPQLPLFYSRPWGEAMLAQPLYLWILPAISAGAIALNFFLSSVVADTKFLARVLSIFALLVCLAATYTGGKIISLLI